MATHNISEVENLLLDGQASVRDLHLIWHRRLPLAAPSQHRYEFAEESSRIDWLEDLGLVRRFMEQALAAQEFLLVCDAAREILDARRQVGMDDAGLVRIRLHFATALTSLGFTNEARAELRKCLTEGNVESLGRKLRAALHLQIGHTLFEEWHQASGWVAQQEAAKKAFRSYDEAARLDPGRIEVLALAACTALIASTGQCDVSVNDPKEIARGILRVAAELKESDGSGRQVVWSEGVAYAILGELSAARGRFHDLQSLHGINTADLAEARYRAQLLAQALDQPIDYFRRDFPPLDLLVFAGHVPDRRGEPARFPSESTPVVRQAMRAMLQECDARVGMSCASAGADLLFAEGVLDRKASLHLILPWAKEEFLRTSVQPFDEPGGAPLWQDLYERAITAASTVREVGHLYEPRSAVGWNYLMEVTAGIALQTARAMRLDIQPVVFWDGQPGRGPGGTEAFHAFWKSRLSVNPRVLPLPTPAMNGIAIAGERPQPGCERGILHQEVKSMLFADVTGYSRLAETATREFINSFLESLGKLVANSRHQPCSVNTWGDAIYAVFDFAQDAGLFALELSEMVAREKDVWLSKGLAWEVRAEDGTVETHGIDVRIGLHTGPVAVHFDPIVRRLGFTGAHVNRAARIEPVAEPGQVFASEEFAAIAGLGAELARLGRSEWRSDGQTAVCEYAGARQLAKKYPGLHRIYRVRARRELWLEELAKAVHASYLEEARKRGETPETSSSLRSWGELSEDLKDANRAQVADIPNKLRAIGWEMVPAGGIPANQFAMTPEQVENLATEEHDRWMEERRRRDWTWGPERQNALKLHPNMVSWEKLPDGDKEKDRSAVREIPQLIAQAGLRLRRIVPPGSGA